MNSEIPTLANMCDHTLALPLMQPASVGVPDGPDHCNIYHIHQNGSIFYRANALFDDFKQTTPSGEETMKTEVAEEFCGDDRLTLMFVLNSLTLQEITLTFTP